MRAGTKRPIHLVGSQIFGLSCGRGYFYRVKAKVPGTGKQPATASKQVPGTLFASPCFTFLVFPVKNDVWFAYGQDTKKTPGFRRLVRSVQPRATSRFSAMKLYGGQSGHTPGRLIFSRTSTRVSWFPFSKAAAGLLRESCGSSNSAMLRPLGTSWGYRENDDRAGHRIQPARFLFQG